MQECPSINNGCIFGNGLEKEYKASFPGVSPAWRFNHDTQNYDLIEEEADIKPSIEPSIQDKIHTVANLPADLVASNR